MQTQSVAEQTPSETPQKRPRGRPRKDRSPLIGGEPDLDALAQQAPDTPSVEVAGQFDYSKPYQHLRPASFFRFIAGYPNQEATTTYLYRIYPVIDKRLVGVTTNFIQKWAGSTTEVEIKRAWGSGVYRLIFTDQNQPKGLVQRAYCPELSIEDPHYPPVVPPEELVMDHPRNASYVTGQRARGQLGGEMRQQNDNGAPAVAELAGTVKDLCGIIATRSAIPPAAAAAPSAESMALNTALVGGLTTLTKTLVDVASKSAVPAPAVPAADPLEILDKTLGRLKEMGLLAPLGGRAAASDGFNWSEFMRAAPCLLQGFAALVGTMQRAAAPAVATPGLAAPSAPAAPGAPSLPGPVPAGELIEIPDGEVDMLSPQVLLALQEVGRRAMEAFKLDIDGDAFAAALCKTSRGERAYELLHQLGKEGILQALQMVPGLIDQLAPVREKLETFLAEFIAYGDGPEVEGQASEVQP